MNAEKTYYLGIDPGKSGAFVLIDYKGMFIRHWDMPLIGRVITAHAICDIFKQIQLMGIKPFTVIEKPHSRPTDARNSIATYHWEAGQLMLAVAFDFPVQLIQPSVWTRSLHIGLPEDLSAKKKSFMAFCHLYPDLAQDDSFLCGKKIYDGRIDALLIAEFGRRLHNGSQLNS
jgi:hypothetical protein